MEIQGKVLEHPLDLVWILGHQLAQRRRDCCAVRALHIREFDNGNRGVLTTSYWRVREIKFFNQFCGCPRGQRCVRIARIECGIDRLFKPLSTLTSNQLLAINEKGGCCANAK